MKSHNLYSYFFTLAIFVSAFILSGVGAVGQDKYEHKSKNKEFCSWNNYNSSDKVSFNERREYTVASTGSLTVDGGRNGGIKVVGDNRSDVLVRACVNTWATTDEAAKALAADIKIATGSLIKAESGTGDENWSVSYDILVPRNTNLKLNAHNGGISIKSVEGSLEFETTNGGVSLSDVAGEVRGRTTNGGVNVALSGNSWKGGGLDVVTTNGGVNLTMPATYAANIETGTTNGGFRSDIPALNVDQEDYKGTGRHSRATRLNTVLNGGGAPIRVITTNGGIRIGSTEKSEKY